MITLDNAIFHLLNGLLGYSRIVVEVAYFLADCAPTMVISALAVYFLTETRHRDHVRMTLLFAFLAALLAWTAADLLAEAVFRPGPYDALERTRLLISPDRHSSLPNVTTAWLFAVAISMLRAPKRLLRGFFLTTAILFGVSRPILGDHWPSDILASFLLGGMASQLVFLAANRLSPLADRFLRAMHAFEDRWLG